LLAYQERHPGRYLRMLRRMRVMVRDYPRAPLLAALRKALEFRLFDLDRLEQMILRRVAKDYFVLDAGPGPAFEEEDHEG